MLLTGAAVLFALTTQAASDPASAVVLMYHRFGEDAHPSTNIRIDQFEQHIEILTSGRYTVLPLEEIVLAMAEGRPLPDRTVAITIDDTYRSTLTQALPRLQAAGLPFTVFVNTDSVGQVGGVLTWDDVRTLEAAGVTIGAHGAGHAHMAFLDRGAMEEDLVRMTSTFLQELGYVPRLFAYPYGEYSAELVAMIRDAGYLAAFGQHSGVAVETADLFTLPRFALNERYGEPDRFASIVENLPLPARDILPEDMPLRGQASNPPAVGFTVLEDAGSLHRLACFASNGADVELVVLGDRRVELRLDRPFPPGRSRINCTIPAEDGRFRWLGIPFLVPGGEE
ncbi:MAG: polysaccharide deacetylase family protein [Rhodospirillaceae bacterium]|nr:polysaccharide deacetylase family protein [Rhodospirillaceae bacterium]